MISISPKLLIGILLITVSFFAGTVGFGGRLWALSKDYRSKSAELVETRAELARYRQAMQRYETVSDSLLQASRSVNRSTLQRLDSLKTQFGL